VVDVDEVVEVVDDEVDVEVEDVEDDESLDVESAFLVLPVSEPAGFSALPLPERESLR
jgi:hypothetical protein